MALRRSSHPRRRLPAQGGEGRIEYPADRLEQAHDKDKLLPLGRLRESLSGIRRADIIIVTKAPPQITAGEMEADQERTD